VFNVTFIYIYWNTVKGRQTVSTHSCIVVVSFIGGGNRRKPLTCRKSLTNFIT